MKDPAFLFYSKDFYEGTRMMLPEERACYMDLLIYQHQNGIIPNDIKRILMYCSGCSEETVKNVLNQKFNQTDNGWLNQKLNQVVDDRSKYKPKKIASACLAGLISSSKLNKKDKEKIKKSFRINDFIEENGELIQNETLIKSRIKDWFNQMVNNLAIGIAIGIKDINKEEEKRGMGEKEETEKSDNSELEMPEGFESIWQQWKEYRKDRKVKDYAGVKWEQIAVNKLVEYSRGDPKIAKEIIEKSISNTWTGFFKLNENNGKPNTENQRFNPHKGRGIAQCDPNQLAEHLARSAENGDLI